MWTYGTLCFPGACLRLELGRVELFWKLSPHGSLEVKSSLDLNLIPWVNVNFQSGSLGLSSHLQAAKHSKIVLAWIASTVAITK